jgi:hypothetical protein
MSSLAIVSDTAPSKHPHPSQDLRSTVEALRRRHRHADAEELGQYLMTALSESDDLLLEACQFVCARISAAIDARARREAAPRDARTRAAKKAVEQAAMAEVVGKVRLAVLDLPITLVSGEVKKLRFTTGGELAQLGSAYQRLAAAVPTDVMLGEILSDQQPQELMQSDSAT